MIDLSGMSKEELRQLQQQIQIELTESYLLDKSTFVPWSELRDLMDKKINNLGGIEGERSFQQVADNDYLIRGIIPNDILEICDYTLGNYELKKWGKGKERRSITRKRYCDRALSKRYQALANELSNIVLKYLKEEDNDC